jgi:ParB family chromosome partitioning protein
MNATTKNPPAKAPARGLGKGLSALMSDTYSPTAEAAASWKPNRPSLEGAVLTVALEDIQPGRFQPRDHFDQGALMELAESIRRNGVVQPILVRSLPGAASKFEIIAGERRWRAAGMTGLREIPVIVRSLDDKKALEIALVENVQREDLNPLEEAAGYQRLMSEFKYTQEELAGAVHKSRSHIANLLRLLELPEDIRQLLLENKLSMGHARALSGIPDAIFLALEVIDKGLSVRQTEKLARLRKGGAPEQRPRKPEEEPRNAPEHAPQTLAQEQAARAPVHRDPDILALEETLSENLGLKVSINDRGQSGEITIAYASLEQLDDILRRLGGSI